MPVILQKRLLDIPAGAEYLSIGKTMLNSMIQSGRVPILRINRRILIDVEDLDNYIDKLKQEQRQKKTG